jgi:hypothetical protein
MAARVIQLAEFTEVAHRNGGVDAAIEYAEVGAGTQFDPDLVAILRAGAEKIFHGLDDANSWDAVLDDEPALQTLSGP